MAVWRAPEPPDGEGETTIDQGSADEDNVSCALHGRAGTVAGAARFSADTGVRERRSIMARVDGECCTSYEIDARRKRECASSGFILKSAEGIAVVERLTGTAMWIRIYENNGK